MSLVPNFKPGSGWHKVPPLALPGSPADELAKRQAAHPCVVFRMRQPAGRRPATAVLSDPWTTGLLLCELRLMHDNCWDATLYEQDLRTPMLLLREVVLARENEGCRLYHGFESVGRGIRFRQTWLCAPTVERGCAILRVMAEREPE